MMKFCKRCLYPENHALNLIISSDGICSGCKVHEEKDSIDWSYRWNELEKLVKQFKCNSGKNYDCIIPVTGAQDSFFIVDTVINRLKMKPLLVNYNSHFNTPEGVRNLSKLKIKTGSDLFQKTVNPITIKKITKSTLKKLGSLYWHVIAGQTVYPVQMAFQLKIPLILWGVHQGINQQNVFAF